MGTVLILSGMGTTASHHVTAVKSQETISTVCKHTRKGHVNDYDASADLWVGNEIAKNRF